MAPSQLPLALSCPASMTGMHAGGTAAIFSSSTQDPPIDPTDPTSAGTLIHRVAAEIILHRHDAGSIEQAASRYARRYPDTPRVVMETAEAYAHSVVSALESIGTQAGPGYILGGIETPLRTPWDGVSDGICDAWIYDSRHRRLTVYELKTGPQDASSFGLIQCRIYALALAGSLPVVPHEVCMHVWQNGKVTDDSMSWTDLQAWEKAVLIPGIERAGENLRNPSQNACRYCSRRGSCMAYIRHHAEQMAALAARYDDLTEIPDSELWQYLDARAGMDAAMDVIRKEVQYRASDHDLPRISESAPRRTIPAKNEPEVLARLAGLTGQDPSEVRQQILKKSNLTVSGIDSITGSAAATDALLGDLIVRASSGRYTVQANK